MSSPSLPDITPQAPREPHHHFVFGQISAETDQPLYKFLNSLANNTIRSLHTH